LAVGQRPRRIRRSRRRRLLPIIALGLLAAAAFATGIFVSLAPGRAERRLVTNYVADWVHGNYPLMYGMLDPQSRARVSEARFAAAYQRAAATATLTTIRALKLEGRQGDVIPVRMRADTRIFGTLRETLEVPLDGSGSSARVRFSSTLLFPGLLPGERLTRSVRLPPRAALLASDGTPLAEGPDRSSPIPVVAGQIVGTLGPIPASQREQYAAAGYPAHAQVGQDGLERIFQAQLVGKLGGILDAGRRILARATPAPAGAVRTTIDPKLEQAAITAMGSKFAGMAAMDPRTGGLLALAGIAFSALQPPGSTMKMITATGALEAGIVKLSSVFPIQTSADIEGYSLSNAGGEACGGTFLNAFAVSCNSVFAPLGARLGGARLVNIAERFGFNQPSSIPGALESTIPSASKIGDSLAVGSSAIGQGMVQTTPLEMADVGATIAMGGRRPIPTLQAGQTPKFVQVTSRHVAAEVQRMMIAVVDYGTGTAAQIPGVTVAGKTGTAELGAGQNTDAWFVGYAPVGHPQIVVGALFPAQGAGGAVAAPAVHDVLVAGLSAH
jgi:Penicillin binding protein transpeptidase domain/Penicillin-binding Protein dimerisation domain